MPDKTGSGPSTASVLGGVGLVGAAAAYAALAFRFRNMGTASRAGEACTKTMPEFRAAEAFSREYLRQEERAKAGAFTQGAKTNESNSDYDKHHESMRQRIRQSERLSEENAQRFKYGEAGGTTATSSTPAGPPTWALRELGLTGAEWSDRTAAKNAYLARAKLAHPDSGDTADDAAFKRLQDAWKEVEPFSSTRRST